MVLTEPDGTPQQQQEQNQLATALSTHTTTMTNTTTSTRATIATVAHRQSHGGSLYYVVEVPRSEMFAANASNIISKYGYTHICLFLMRSFETYVVFKNHPHKNRLSTNLDVNFVCCIAPNRDGTILSGPVAICLAKPMKLST